MPRIGTPKIIPQFQALWHVAESLKCSRADFAIERMERADQKMQRWRGYRKHT